MKREIHILIPRLYIPFQFARLDAFVPRPRLCRPLRDDRDRGKDTQSSIVQNERSVYRYYEQFESSLSEANRQVSTCQSRVWLASRLACSVKGGKKELSQA